MSVDIIPQVVLSFLVVIVSLTFHELAHAASANALGDPTAKNMGRMSANPLVHIDPVGTVLFPILLAALGLGVFGWAKPVPVNPSNLRHPRRDDAIVSAAGPAANLLLACVCAVAARIIVSFHVNNTATVFLLYTMILMIRINIFLMLFNLLPIAPLDGSGVLQGFLSPRSYMKYMEVSRRLVVFFLIILLATDWFYQFYLLPFSRIFLYGLQFLAGIPLV